MNEYYNNKPLPRPTLRRLTAYYSYLKQLALAGDTTVSAPQIAEALGLIPILVRKDLAATGCVGKPKIGFCISELITTIEHILAWNTQTTACIVGMGSLGKALALYPGFREHGLNIMAAFDINPELIGKNIQGIPIFSAENRVEYVEKNKIELGIITVPTEHAQDTANKLIQGGILAIWNFSSASLDVPKNIILQNESLLASFAVLSHDISRKKKGLSLSSLI